MKISTGLFILTLCTLNAMAQENSCDSVYRFADQMPVYGNGTEDMLQYLRKNLKIHKPCRPEEIRQFIWTINKQGKMVDIDIVGYEGKCKTQAIEDLKSFPTWTPAMHNRKQVCVRMVVPIHIRPSD